MRDQSPWIELHSGAREHPKIIELAAKMQVPFAHAFGLVSALWASPYAITHGGNLAGCSDAYVAALAKWEGSPNGFAGHLREVKLLDRDGMIHDYPLHGTRILTQSRQKQADYRDRKRKLAARKALRNK